jgi:hypothetical protein
MLFVMWTPPYTGENETHNGLARSLVVNAMRSDTREAISKTHLVENLALARTSLQEDPTRTKRSTSFLTPQQKS